MRDKKKEEPSDEEWTAWQREWRTTWPCTICGERHSVNVNTCPSSRDHEKK